ncbi:MAG TPA: PIG-L family deacetylase [Armatimonadetes bacterium]|nr:PIG-L family deacetylase [Armatimonadota bacterium]
MRVLAVGAHPDDLELLCAGTLARFKAQGAEIFMAYLCTGDKGHFEIPGPELAEMRKKEAAESAKVLEAQIRGGIAPDLELYHNAETVGAVIDLVRWARPDLILTHAPNDYMVDHYTTSQIVVAASFTASLPNYQSELPAIPQVPALFFMDTLGGFNFQPTEYVDITEVMETKEKMLLCHQSQYKWLWEHDKIDYVEFMRKLAAFRGLQCGVPYAEGFQQYLVFGRVRPQRLLP